MKGATNLEGRHALITGAASGIGRATAVELARRGARVSLADIDADGVQATADAARALGSCAAAFAVDMSSEEQVDSLAARVVSRSGPVDVLVNNAGVAVIAPFLRTSVESWEWILAINLLGPIRLTRALLPSMIERKTGQVVMVAALAGLVGAPAMVAYSTTKFALVGFAESLRHEVADAGVSVTVVCPGFVRTNMAKANRYDNSDFRRFLDEAPSWYGLSKERVAVELADAVEARKALVVLGPEKVGWWLKRVAPEAAFAAARWAARRAKVGAAPVT